MDNEVVTRDAKPQGGRAATMFSDLIVDVDGSLHRLFFGGGGRRERGKEKGSVGIVGLGFWNTWISGHGYGLGFFW